MGSAAPRRSERALIAMSEGPIPKRTAAGSGPVVLVSNRQEAALDEPALTEVARDTLAGEGVTDGELSVSFVTEDEMADLHQRYLAESGPTDVLSFALGDDGLLGDVIVCPSQAARNNPEDVAGELRLLVAHGVLHILGYDHEEDDERATMWAAQERYSGVRTR
jgi:probable rRNA maturation factor